MISHHEHGGSQRSDKKDDEIFFPLSRMVLKVPVRDNRDEQAYAKYHSQ